ncbi:MAG: 4-hydroxy-3-methylbut-2-enyl diphosphate reductase [Alphaproteobacteria bacterium]
MTNSPRRPLTVLLANPRGFCAGVDRAIDIVECALAKYGKPVYVLHDIVHNHVVVEELRRKGAAFVESLDDVPEAAPVVFSAHGVAKRIEHAAHRKNLVVVDATCPLVHKVHSEVRHHVGAGRHVVVIGHAGHAEVLGTAGQAPVGAVTLVQTVRDAETVKLPSGKLAYVTQTTLDVRETDAIVAALHRRFPGIVGPAAEDICYATSNRQGAVRDLAPLCQAFVVVGAPHSSNSRRLVETAEHAGCANAFMLETAEQMDWQRLDGVAALGLTASASAPEAVVRQLLEALAARYDLSLEERPGPREDIRFNLPKALFAA